MAGEVEAQGAEKRAVGASLAIGILLLPFVFAWFTLRKGYGQVARSVSFVWMVLALLMWIGASKLPADTQPILDSEGDIAAASAVADTAMVSDKSAPAAAAQANADSLSGTSPDQLRIKALQAHGCGMIFSIIAARNSGDQSTFDTNMKLLDLYNGIGVKLAIMSGMDEESAKQYLKNESSNLPESKWLQEGAIDNDFNGFETEYGRCEGYIKNADADWTYAIKN